MAGRPAVAAPDDPRADVARYFGARLRAHGPTPRGVDWNSEEAQLVRFEQLLRVVDPAEPFSLIDYGCGYGALLDLLTARGWRADYRGYDVSAEMIQAAIARHGQGPGRRFVVDAADLEPADYGVASGVFNVRVGRSDEQWRAHLERTLDELRALSRRGFAFNALTSYSDPERMRADLHYADPCTLFDLCKRRYSRQVALLHDYGIWDFTILVRLEG
jgi:SAM-dependent methyltransferase